MARLPSGISAIVCTLLCVLNYAALQVFHEEFTSSEIGTILGGFCSSLIFIWALTAINNFETALFNSDFTAKFFPEVLIALAVAMAGAISVHRVSATTCLIFSLVHSYFLNQVSNAAYYKTK